MSESTCFRKASDIEKIFEICRDVLTLCCPSTIRFVWPSSNVEYWIPKINRNVERDVENHKKLIDMGWKVLIVWECELKKNMRENRLEKLFNEIR